MIKKYGLKVICALALICLLAACDYRSTYHEIRYAVDGTALTVNITYSNADGGTSQETGVPVPWEHSFGAQKGGLPIHLGIE